MIIWRESRIVLNRMRREKISIIIPVFNVEKYIEKCLESVINQTYENLEIIVVDDGSTDHSGFICDEYAKKDERIRVIHQDNKGISVTRNVGINEASGDYIAFVDSDDYIDNEMYEILLKCIETYDADIAICKFDRFDNHKHYLNEDSEQITIYEGYDIFEYEFRKHEHIQMTHVLWNKLYKKEMFHNIKFLPDRIAEDFFIHNHIYGKSKKIVLIDKSLYHYCIGRNESYMSMSYNGNRIDEIYARQERVYMVKDKVSKELYQEMITEYINTSMLHMQYIEDSNLEVEEKQKLMKDICNILTKDKKILQKNMIHKGSNTLRFFLFACLKEKYIRFMKIINKYPMLTKIYLS